MEGDFVLESILCTFGGAALLCIASLLRVVVRAGLKDKSSVPARLLDTGACMAPTCQPPSSRLSVPLAPSPPSPHHTHARAVYSNGLLCRSWPSCRLRETDRRELQATSQVSLANNLRTRAPRESTGSHTSGKPRAVTPYAHPSQCEGHQSLTARKGALHGS